MTWAITTMVLMSISGVLGYYIRGRGIKGVVVDVSNIPGDVTKVEANVKTAVQSL